MLKERNTRRGFLEREQVDEVCGALERAKTVTTAEKSRALANVVRFAFATGWRTASEVLPLEWRNVDWAGRVSRLDGPGGGPSSADHRKWRSHTNETR